MIIAMTIAAVVSCLYLRAVSKQLKVRDEEERLEFEHLMSSGRR